MANAHNAARIPPIALPDWQTPMMLPDWNAHDAARLEMPIMLQVW